MPTIHAELSGFGLQLKSCISWMALGALLILGGGFGQIFLPPKDSGRVPTARDGRDGAVENRGPGLPPFVYFTRASVIMELRNLTSTPIS